MAVHIVAARRALKPDPTDPYTEDHRPFWSCSQIRIVALESRSFGNHLSTSTSLQVFFLCRTFCCGFYCSLISEGRLMSAQNVDNISQPQLSAHIFDELLDSIIIDVASECHRVAKLGLDQNIEEEDEELRLSAQARARVADPSETNGKYVVDIFGQTHPPVANEIFECMNCGRSIMAGRFAPHLEKCMGKGRKARLKATRSSTAQNRYTRGSSASTYSPYSNPTSTSRLPNGISGVSGHEYSNGFLEEL